MEEITSADWIRQRAAEGRFVDCRIADPDAEQAFVRLCRWLDAGYAGSMAYIERRRDAYRSAAGVLPGCQAVIMLASSYHNRQLSHPPAAKQPEAKSSSDSTGQPHREPLTGAVAGYASAGPDYHDVIRRRMKTIIAQCRQRWPENHFRGVVDTAPLLERDFAARSGMGWIGKNSMLISKTQGSYILLSAILTDLPLPTDRPLETDHCGTCRACLDACPTEALVEPRILDASRCLSYATIEHRGVAGDFFLEHPSDWVFGCDICQQVCPWNRRPADSEDPDLAINSEQLDSDLLEWLSMDEPTFAQRYGRTPLSRATLSGLQRNAMLSIGYWLRRYHDGEIVIDQTRLNRCLELLRSMTSSEREELRLAAAWAISQLPTTPGQGMTADRTQLK